MSPAFRYSLIWICGALLLVFAALGTIDASYVDGHYIPSNADAFYHARRILDSVLTHSPVIQFDPRIQAPEGSWLVWPWGFDTLLASITSAFGPYPDEFAASRVLMNIPVALAPIAVALVLVLARQLRLSTAFTALAVVAFAALPANYLLYAVGNVDHHCGEQLWLLMTLVANLWFFGAPDRRAPGIVLGVVLGTALAITNGLFILQLTVLLPFAWRWLRGESLPDRRAVIAFAATLIVITLLVSWPSQPWRRGFFEFYTLSWFHTYVSAGTAAFVVLMRWLEGRRRNVIIVVACAALAAAPLVGMVLMASGFVKGDLEVVKGVVETLSPYRLYHLFGAEGSTRYNSSLMWLAMPAWVINVYWAARSRDVRLQVFACAGVLFLALYQLQFRFGALGSVPLILTVLVAAAQAFERWNGRRWLATALTAALFAVAYVPTAGAWSMKWARGGDPQYDKVRVVFPDLARACRAAPGIVLASVNDGHWITFHTSCSVIGDVFLLTQQQAQKRDETERLLRLTPTQLQAQRPDIRYVLVHHDVDVGAPAGPGLPENPDVETLRPRLPALMRDLLGPREAIPSGFVLLRENPTPAGRAYTRLFSIPVDRPGVQ